MGRTLVDSLVVEFGLDPAPFKKKESEVDSSLKKFKEKGVKASGEVSKSMKDTGETLRKLRDQVIALFAIFTAGKGLKEFISDLVQTNAEAGRVAETLDTNVSTLSAWRGAAVLVGGTAEGITSSIQGLVSQFQQFSLTGESSVIPYFRALGVNIADSEGKMRPISAILLDVAGAFEKLDPARAAEFGRSLGFDSGTINLLRQGRAAVQAQLDEQKKLGVITDEDAKAARALQASWGAMEQASGSAGRVMFTVVAPAILAVLNGLKDMGEWLLAHKTVLEIVFDALAGAAIILAGAITATLVPAIVGLGVAFLATPFGWITAGIAGLVAAGLFLSNHWDGVSAWWTGLWQGLGDVVRFWVDVMKSAWASVEGIWSKLFGAPKAQPRPPAKAAPKPTTVSPRSPAPAASPPAGSKAAKRQAEKTAIDKFVDMGWTREQSAGIVANLQRESGGNPTAVGDKGQAYGLAQWHPDRQEAFARWAGHDIRSATSDEQLAFVNYELRHGEKRAGDALAKTKDAGSASDVVSRLYERPEATDKEASIRSVLASALLKAHPGTLDLGTQAQGAVNSTYDNRASSKTETSIGQIVVNTQATDAEGIARDIGPALDRNTFAEQANYGPS